MLGQLPDLFGVDKSGDGFFGQLAGLVTRLGSLDPWSTALGLAAVALVVAGRRWLPGVPGSLVVALAGIAAVTLFHLDRYGVAVVGHIAPGLPRFGLPDGVDGSGYLSLAGPAVGVLLVGFAEGLGAAKTYAARYGYRVDPNRELLGLGAANLGSGLASGMVVNGSLSKTAVNAAAGARTRWSGVLVAGLTVVTLLFLTGPFERLPMPVLAAIVVAAVIELVDVSAIRRLYRVGTGHGLAARVDFWSAVAAMLGVLVFGTLPGLATGIAISLLLLLYRASRPHVAVLGRLNGVWVDVVRHPRARPEPNTVVLRVESGLFFANSEHVAAVLREHCAAGVTRMVLDARTVPFVDVTAARMLADLAAELDRLGVALALAQDVGQVRDVLRRSGTAALPPTWPTVDDALRELTEPSDRR